MFLMREVPLYRGTPWDHHTRTALGIGLLQGPRPQRFLMIEVHCTVEMQQHACVLHMYRGTSHTKKCSPPGPPSMRIGRSGTEGTFS